MLAPTIPEPTIRILGFFFILIQLVFNEQTEDRDTISLVSSINYEPNISRFILNFLFVTKFKASI